MISLLGSIEEYLTAKLEDTYVCYTQMPDKPEVCVVLYEDEPQYGLQNLIPPQIDAEVHYIRIRIRHMTYNEAYMLAGLVCGFMQTDSPEYPAVQLSDIDTTGIINLSPEFSVQSLIVRNPRAVADEEPTQQGLRMVEFLCRVITKKLY